MKKSLFLLILLIFSLLLVKTNALKIELKVSPVLKGDFLIFNYTSLVFQTFQGIWMNTGSIGCKVRANFEIFNNSELLYVAWSKEYKLWPSQSSLLEAYAHLPEGNYSFYVNVLHCYKTFTYGPFEIESYNKTNHTKIVEIIDVRVFEKYVELKVKGLSDLEEIIFVPVSYPFGWIFESEKLEKIEKDESKMVKLNYEPSIWEETNVTIEIIEKYGNFTTYTFELKKEKTLYQILNKIKQFLEFLGKKFSTLIK